jgi:hypothetical protein
VVILAAPPPAQLTEETRTWRYRRRRKRKLRAATLTATPPHSSPARPLLDASATQVCVNPTQVCVNPTQVCVNPTPVCVNPTQVCVNPTPVYVTPTQVLRTAVRRPELHPDDAHFAGGFTVAVLSLELELQALLEASPSPPSKCSAPAHTPCWGLGAARVVQPHAPPSHHGHSAAAPSPHERLSTRSATLSLCAQRSVRIQAKFRAFFVTRLDRGTTKHTSQPEPLP